MASDPAFGHSSAPGYRIGVPNRPTTASPSRIGSIGWGTARDQLVGQAHPVSPLMVDQEVQIAALVGLQGVLDLQPLVTAAGCPHDRSQPITGEVIPGHRGAAPSGHRE